MDQSESQFGELLAHLLVRVNRMLAAGQRMPLALVLRNDGSVAVSAGIVNTPEELEEVLAAMQDSLRAQVADPAIVATCVAYPDHDNQTYIAWLENRENYCLKVTHPIIAGPAPAMGTDGIEADDGDVFIFPHFEEDA